MLCGNKSTKDDSAPSYFNMDGITNRRSSGNDQKKPDIHNQLLEYVQKNDIENIRRLIYEHNELLYMKYPHPYFKSIIPITRFNFSRKIQFPTLEELIDIGYNINCANGKTEELVFFAAASGRAEKLTEALEIMKKHNPGALNNTREGDTALMFLIKYGNATKSYFPVCAKILVDANIDVNVPDYKNCTPVLRASYLYHMHAKKPTKDQNPAFLENLHEVIRIILDPGEVDVDSHMLYEKNARSYININNLYHLPKPSKKRAHHRTAKEHLFSLVIAKNENGVRNMKGVKSYDLDDGENTLLQLACFLKLENAVKHFLKHGANPNLTTTRNKDKPIEMAAKMNHHNIFHVLLSWKTTKIDEETYNRFAARKGNKFKEKYFVSLLNSKKLDVDLVCREGNTPLHFAAMFSENQVVLQLLHRGASILVKNTSGERPIDYIDPRTLSKFVDECVESKESQNIYHKKSTISFNYHFLLKNNRIQGTSRDSVVDIEDIASTLLEKQEKFRSETEVVLAISDMQDTRNLLKHPVISSFLYVKWYKIKSFFWMVMLLHAWCYTMFVYYLYHCSKLNYPRDVTFWMFIVTFIMYVCFLAARIIATRADLNMNFHIYMECLLAVMIFVTIFITTVSIRRHFAVFGVILGAFSLVFWTGYHPKMSSHVAMLQRVSYNFFKILFCYCILILAFALSFYILFNKTEFADSRLGEGNRTQEQEASLFVNPGTAIFKTFVMISGEFETSGFQFQNSSFSSCIVFLLFVFMISLILMNLLTGVAVADTETIQNESEVVGHTATIRFIRFFEMILQPSFVPKMMDVRKCFLLPDALTNYKLTIYPNMRGKVKCDPALDISKLEVDRRIVKEARNVIIRREIKYNRELELGGNSADIKLLQGKVEEIAEKQRIYYKKFQESIDQIVNNLSIITENFEIVPDF